MAIANLTITNEELNGKKISDIVGDTLVGTPAENKALFDAYSEVIKEKFNDLIDTLGNFLSSSGVGVGDLSDTIKLILENGAEYSVPKLDANNKIASKYIDDASSSAKGLMSAEDKAKLDTLQPAVNSVASGTTNPPTSNAVYSSIETVNDRISSIEGLGRDYIVNYGSRTCGAKEFDGRLNPIAKADWVYRKWYSGISECFGYVEYRVDNWQQWGSVYYGQCVNNDTPLYFSFMYPEGLFKDGTLPFVIASGGAHDSNVDDVMCAAFGGTSGGKGTNTYTPKLYAIRPQVGIVHSTYAIFVHAFGVWE